MKIVTLHVYPPIPIRTSDWCAFDDETFDGSGGPIGWGPTREAAIQDLLEHLGLDQEERNQ